MANPAPLSWAQTAPGLWRSLDGRYAILAVVLPERPRRIVYQARKIDQSMARAYPERGDLGHLLEESPWAWNCQNDVHSAEAIIERDAYRDAHADQLNVPNDLPAVALQRFYWPISDGTSRAGLAIVRDGDRLVARLVGMTRRDDGQGYEPGARAEIDLTGLGIHTDARNITRHGVDPCNCGARVGIPHRPHCSVARCLATGGQRLMCDALDGRPAAVENDGEMVIGSIRDGHDCGQDVWTGKWPGVAECEEFGWYCQGYQEGRGYVPCSPDAPGAIPDLNRLTAEARWDPESKRWVRR